jgi:hypothetical protein
MQQAGPTTGPHVGQFAGTQFPPSLVPPAPPLPVFETQALPDLVNPERHMKLQVCALLSQASTPLTGAGTEQAAHEGPRSQPMLGDGGEQTPPHDFSPDSTTRLRFSDTSSRDRTA